jgi:hypothetical protein
MGGAGFSRCSHEENRTELLVLLGDYDKTIKMGRTLVELHFYGKKHKTDEILSELTALHDELIAKLKKTRCNAEEVAPRN